MAAVAENREPFVREVHWLFHSLRRFGESLSDANAIAYFVGDAPRDTSRLRDLNVEIRVVREIDRRCPHANKINVLLNSDPDCDWLVSLDTDVVIVGGVGPYLLGTAVGAKPVDQDPLSDGEWRAMFQYFALPFPSARFLTHFKARETIPYFNSGVLIIPGEHAVRLGSAWRDLIPAVLDMYALEPSIARHSFFTDQFALTLAMVKAAVPYRALPLELNFPTHAPIHPLFRPAELTPLVLHHHHMTDSGRRLAHCDYANVNVMIDRFNQSIRFTDFDSIGER